MSTEIDERQPLLQQSLSKPLPLKPFATLLFMRATDAIAFVIIFPFITPMLLHLGAPVNRVGFYSGLAEGGMMIIEAVLAPMWAKIGPRVGKFRCLQFGTVCSVTAVLLMGFSSAPWQVVLCRFCMGVNPMSLLSRSLLADMVTPATRVRAFSLFTPSYVAGIMIGNFLGGFLARPGGSFGRTRLLQRWPFVLPSFFCAFITVFALGASGLFLGKYRSDQKIPADGEQAIAASSTSPEGRKSNIWQDMRRCAELPGFKSMIAMVGFFQCTRHGWNALFPLHSYTDVRVGGLGLSIPAIGGLLAASTMIYMTASITIFARVHSAIGPSRLIPICVACFPILILCFPLGEWVALAHRNWLWTVLGAQLILRNVAAFTNQMVDTSILAMVELHPEMTSMAYALKMLAAASGAAVGPVAAGTLFSASREAPLYSFRHSLGWLVLFILSLPMCVIAVYRRQRGLVHLS